MKYLRKFTNDAAYEAATLNYPSVSLIDNTREVKYDPIVPAPTIEMVDLGLSVKWASANLGATCVDTPESWYGGFYAWGETETKSDYSWSTYKYVNGAFNKLTKYCPSNKTNYWRGEGDPDNKTILDAVDDVVNVELGGNYRMPTEEEIQELMTLPNQWVTNYNGISGLNGRIFTGTNGNTLFIPAAGYFNGSAHNYAGSYCYLWSSSLNSADPSSALGLYFNSGINRLDHSGRCDGFSVRAVQSVNS